MGITPRVGRSTNQRNKRNGRRTTGYLKPQFPDTEFELFDPRAGLAAGPYVLKDLMENDEGYWGMNHYPAPPLVLRVVKQEGNKLYLAEGRELHIRRLDGKIVG